MPPFQAALQGSREVGFTIISISISLVAVFIPIFFMPGRDRPAVPRVRGGRLAGHRRLGLRLADAGADAGQPLPHRRGAQEAAAARWCACSSAPSTRTLGRLHAHRSTWRCAIARVVLRGGAADLRRHGLAVRHHSQGLLPRGGHRPDLRISTEAAEDISFPAMVRAAGRARRRSCAPTRTCATVSSFNGGFGAQNTGRMFVNLKPRAERQPMKQVVEGLRRKLREVPGITVYHAADAEPAARRRARARRSTSTSCRA